MPHRKQAKSDIGTSKVASDSYDVNNIYLSEEGWVYRHFKKADKTQWWDEIIVAGQVKPGMEIGEVTNNPVVPTNPLKLGVAGDPTDGSADYPDHFLAFGNGGADGSTDGLNDFEYSPLYGNETEGGGVPWQGINVADPGTSEVPDSWTDTSSPLNTKADTQPPYPGEGYENINLYPPYKQDGSDIAEPDVDHIVADVDPAFDMGSGAVASTNIGAVAIVGAASTQDSVQANYTWTVSGGDYAKADLTHTWSITDGSATATIDSDPTANQLTITPSGTGDYTINISVVEAGAANSPVTQTKSVTVA